MGKITSGTRAVQKGTQYSSYVFIQHDVFLAFMLPKLLNSDAFGFFHHIYSIFDIYSYIYINIFFNIYSSFPLHFLQQLSINLREIMVAVVSNRVQ